MKNKENKSLLSKSCEYIYEIISKLFDSNKKKFVIKSKCKDSCCCKNCDCIVGYDEKSDDDDSIDISVNDDNITIS